MTEIIDLNKGRNASISAIRMISMVFIILCHFFQYYENELCKWFNVGVQIFFVISGWLYANKQIDDPISFILRNFKKILVPYWSFLFAAVILYLLFARDYLSPIDVFKSVVCAGTIKGLGHLWFVGYILFCYLLTPYLYWLKLKMDNKSTAKSIVIYSIILVAIQITGFAFNSYFLPYRVSCYVIGFFMGSLWPRFSKKNKRIFVLFVLIPTIIMSVGRIYFRYLTNGCFEGMALTAFVLYSHMMLGITIFLVLIQLLHSIKYNAFLHWSDSISYHIYIVHVLFILSPFSLMELTAFSVINYLFIIIATIVTSICLKIVCQRILHN